jgi:hypothetical protein
LLNKDRGQEKTHVTINWFENEMTNKIQHINWPKAVADVMPFVKGKDRQTLSLWNKDFFLDKLQKFIALYDQGL